uniref:C2H2-type domain-containing protein n=1 Tax=Glossina morsitans morsitans TaxID=37546 RepID=A0A1B0G487_GLOMM
MTEIQYEAKFKEMQKYLPFLEKTRTLQSDESIISDKIRGNQQDVYDLTGPESPPPPEQNALEEHTQPVEIPTERRCSPLLVKERKSHHYNHHHSDQHQRASIHGKSCSSLSQRHNYYNRQDQDHRYNFQERAQTKISLHHSPSISQAQRESHQHHQDKHRHRNVDDSAKVSSRCSQFQTKTADEQYLQKVKVVITESSPPDDRRQDSKACLKLLQDAAEPIQKVKVVITEPLSSEVTRQHFPSLPSFNKAARFTTNNNIDVLEHCRNSANLQKSDNNAVEDNEAYSPRESWDEYSRKTDNIKTQNTRCELPQSVQKLVFSRLGNKIENEKPAELKDPRSPSTHSALPKSIPARITPIPEVLKSPPLSASDITNLLNETSDDNMDNSLSEIGQRRPKKPDSSRSVKYDTPIMTSSSLDFVRKKFALIAKLEGSDKKISSSTLNRLTDSPASPSSSSSSLSGTRTERLALKYNPHPRSEREWSVSSHESYGTSGGGYFPKTRDSHSYVNNKLPAVPVNNVNVLPTINLNDPRLKRTNSIIPTQISPTLTKSPLLSNQIVAKSIPKPFSGSRNDPRLNAAASRTSLDLHSLGFSKIGDVSYQWEKKETTVASGKTTTSSKKPSSKPLDYSSEENWDSEPEMSPKIKEKKQITSDRQHRTSHNSMDADEENWDSDSDALKTAKAKGSFPPRTSDGRQQRSNLGVSNPTRTPINSVNYAADNRDSDSEILKLAKPKGPLTARPNSLTQQRSQISVQNFMKKDALLPTPNNRFNAALNDKTERMKYLESKKFKDNEPKTYKEFREAKAKAQEAAKKASQKPEVNIVGEKADEKKLKEADVITPQKNSTETNLSKEGKAEKSDSSKKASSLNDSKKKIPEKSCSITETALDKMYRTQNFCNKEFVINKNKFKIPKKKSEEPVKKLETTESVPAEKASEKVVGKQTNVASMIPTGEEKKEETGEQSCKSAAQSSLIKPLSIKTPRIILNSVKSSEGVKKNTIKSKEDDLSMSKTSKINNNTKEKDKTTENSSLPVSTKISEGETSTLILKDKEINNKGINEALNVTQHSKLRANVANKNENVRISPAKVNEQKHLPTSESDKKLGNEQRHADDVDVHQSEFKKPEVCSSEVTLNSSNTNVNATSKESVKCFGEESIQLSRSALFKASRILRRRSTMISYGSAPEVDKEKLRESNSLLFEDVQVQQWRKENLTSQLIRRNRNLEGIFQKTDDNCTVSTQNIISGKRRTRASINFNETQNVKAIFNKKRATGVVETKKDNINQKSEEFKNLKDVKTGGRRSKACTPDRQNSEKGHEDASECSTANNKEAATRESVKSLEDVSNNEKDQVSKIKNNAKGNKTKSGANANKEDVQTRSGLNYRKKANSGGVIMTKEIKTEKETIAQLLIAPGNSTDKELENQNSAVSSTSTELPLRAVEKHEKKHLIPCGTEEPDDNEPSSSGAKSTNPTPTPVDDETNRHAFLNEFVQEIFKPDSNKEHILSLLRQILDKDKFEFIKTVIESAIKSHEERLPQTLQDDPKSEKDDKAIDIPADSNRKLSKTKGNKNDDKTEHSPKSNMESEEVGDNNLNETGPEKSVTLSKPCPKSKKLNASKGEKKERKSQAIDEISKIHPEVGSTELVKNININWHNQSKYINWCMICLKKLQGAHSSALHYRLHHCENYVSRFAPIILQKFKQGKLAKPLFGVKRSDKSPSWFHRCPFCLTYFINTMATWVAHYQEHTAEYKYECSNCFRGSQRITTIRKHVGSCKSCKGAKVVNTPLKLTESNWLKAHVCHLCNFVQLKRNNLERHYLLQHNLSEKNVDLLGYTITLLNVEEVECVDEVEAAAREADAWKKIKAEEEIIDIDDDNNSDVDKSSTQELQAQQDISTENGPKDKQTTKKPTVCEIKVVNIVTETATHPDNKQNCPKDVITAAPEVLKSSNTDNEQDWQDELLCLAAKAAENVEETNKQQEVEIENKKETEKLPDLLETAGNVDVGKQGKMGNPKAKRTETVNESEEPLNIVKTSATVTDLNRTRSGNKRLSPALPITKESKPKRMCVESKISSLRSLESLDITRPEPSLSTEPNVSNAVTTIGSQQRAIDNAFVTSRNSTDSPTIDTVTLAQSFVQLDDLTSQPPRNEKPTICTSIAERISQIFKNMKETDQATTSTCQMQTSEIIKETPEILPDLAVEVSPSDSAMVSGNEDDEDWEDIEITESAPSTCTSAVQCTASGGKTKNKGLFQKFIFKGAKPKKLTQPVVYFGKKKTTKDNKETLSQAAAVKEKESIVINASGSGCNLGFKPVINIIDDLLPDSPCHDPIELVPELAPLEPLQDLNDISSILDADLSGTDQPLCIDTGDHQTSIEDALDFINEQQAQEEKQQQQVTISSSHKTVTNRIQHVGYSLMTNAESKFKFYCLLDNCSFLFSNDSMGLENHYMLEHAETRWSGYCAMCQTQILPANEDHPIIKEIRHMVEKHAKLVKETEKDFLANGNSNSNSGASEERPRIKLRRLTGDCLSATSSENSLNTVTANVANVNSPTNSLLGALLNAKPRPPTKEMPAPPLLPITEPLLMDDLPPLDPLLNLQISQVVSLGAQQQQKGITNTTPAPSLQTSAISGQLPKIMNVCSLNTKAGSLWSQHIARERQDLAEASKEIAQIFLPPNQSIRNPAPTHTNTTSSSPEPIVVSETVPVAQARAGDFVITQTLSAQYEGRQTQEPQLGINISISSANLNAERTPLPPYSGTTAVPQQQLQQSSKQFKCMGNGCKYLTRVPVAMSDHLRFHEKRNLSLKREYLNCGFCQYKADSVDNYMKHAEEAHAIAKTGVNGSIIGIGEKDTASTLSRKIQDILRNQTNSKNAANNSISNQHVQHTPTVATEKLSSEGDEEIFLKKLSETIEEIVAPTGLSESKLYRCVLKECLTPLSESTFNQHVIYHTSTNGYAKDLKYYYKCPHCPVQYQRPAGLKAHIKIHARSRFFCYLCDQIASNPGQMLRHFTETHWHTLNMNTTLLLNCTYKEGQKQELSAENSYYVVYTQQLEERDVKEFGKKLIAEWQRKKATSKTHFKSTEIDLLPIQPIFQREINCGECEYRTKVRTNMYRHLLMHKQTEAAGKTGAANIVKVASVDPVNPVPCLNTNEKFFDKMTNLASSSVLAPHSKESHGASTLTKPAYKMPFTYVNDSKRYTCGALGCKYLTLSEEIFRSHLTTLHSKIMIYRCPFCENEVCKRGLSVERITAHLKFHGPELYRCEECNYLHYLRFLVERHINEKHATQKVNLIKHERVKVGEADGTCTSTAYTGKKYKETLDLSSSNTVANRPQNAESSQPSISTKSKHKWVCDLCDHRAVTLNQIQSHCSAEHGQKHQYQCVHCAFGSTQLSQILYHIDEKHNGKTREARYMYHRAVNSQGDETNSVDTRPLWQRNDPTRVRHIRGILMEDEEESERNRRRFVSAEDDEFDDDINTIEEEVLVDGGNSEILDKSFMNSFEYGCLHCNYKTKNFAELKQEHWSQQHNSIETKAKPFYFRLLRRFSCAECRQFVGTHEEMRIHLTNVHGARYCAADIQIQYSEDKLLCGYCSFSCNTPDQLYKHHQRRSHQPQDLRIEHGLQMTYLLKLGSTEKFLQCCICNEIFANRSVIVAHASERHSKAEGFSFRELSDKLIYCCVFCPYANVSESEACRHMIGHYGQFKCCHFCQEPQNSFEVYMQHCYSEHREGIRKFKDIFPFKDIRKFLLQLYILFPNGLVVNKRNVLKCKYGSLNIIHQVYCDLCKTSQQPPIPRLSLGRLVAKMEQEQKPAVELQAKAIKKRRCTIAVDSNETAKWPMLKPPSPIQQTISTTKSIEETISAVKEQQPKKITQRRCTVALGQEENPWSLQASTRKLPLTTEISTLDENSTLQTKKVTKRRCTTTNECCIDLNSDNSNCSSSCLTKDAPTTKKRKLSDATHTHPPNPDMEPFSFYGKPANNMDLSKIYTKAAIGGLDTPITIDKFKLLFNIDARVVLHKYDQNYCNYKHITKACPANQKFRYT